MFYTLEFLLLTLIAIGALSLLAARARRREERYRSMLDQVPSTAISVFDRDLRFTQVLGEAVVRDAGLVPADVLGKRPDEIFEGEAGQTLLGHFRGALAGRSAGFEFLSPATGVQFLIQVAPLVERGEVVGGMSVSQNVSELRAAEREVFAEAHRRSLILDSMNEAYVAGDADGIVTDWNRAAEQTFGWSAAEAIGRPITELIIPGSDHEEFLRTLERQLAEGPASGPYAVRVERRAVNRVGHEFPVELAATLVEADGVTTLHAFAHDISRRKRAEQNRLEHTEEVEALAAAVSEIAHSTVARDARTAICRSATRIAGAEIGMLFEPDPSGTGLRVTGAEGADVVGRLLHFTQQAGATTAFSSREVLFINQIQDNPAYAYWTFLDTSAKSVLWVPVQSEGMALGVIAVGWRTELTELTERHERVMKVISAEAAVAIERAGLLDRLEQLALTDELTGLTNRRSWDIELSRERLRATRDGTPLVVAMLDLDHFKAYNDRLGHQAGDRFLREAAGAWEAVLRETDLLARYGGEEFAVALPGCDPELAEELVERLRERTPAGESCSAGIACWDGSESAEALVGRADAALYAAKQRGRDCAVVA